MKCATCKYEYDIESWEEEYEEEKDFQEIFFSNEIKTYLWRQNPYENHKKVTLYMCPECGTVKAVC